MEKAVIILLFAVGFVCCKEYTPVQQCGSEKLFKNVAITGRNGLCKKLPCNFKLGEQLTVEIEFTNKRRIETIFSKCSAKVLGQDIDFPIPDAEKGCDQLVNAKCPVEPNKDLEMKLTVPVMPPSLAKAGVDVKLQFHLYDQKKEVISCFQLTAKVAVV